MLSKKGVVKIFKIDKSIEGIAKIAAVAAIVITIALFVILSHYYGLGNAIEWTVLFSITEMLAAIIAFLWFAGRRYRTQTG